MASAFRPRFCQADDTGRMLLARYQRGITWWLWLRKQYWSVPIFSVADGFQPCRFGVRTAMALLCFHREGIKQSAQALRFTAFRGTATRVALAVTHLLKTNNFAVSALYTKSSKVRMLSGGRP